MHHASHLCVTLIHPLSCSRHNMSLVSFNEWIDFLVNTALPIALLLVIAFLSFKDRIVQFLIEEVPTEPEPEVAIAVPITSVTVASQTEDNDAAVPADGEIIDGPHWQPRYPPTRYGRAGGAKERARVLQPDLL